MRRVPFKGGGVRGDLIIVTEGISPGDIIAVGVLGLGFMGKTHLRAYELASEAGWACRVVAVAEDDVGSRSPNSNPRAVAARRFEEPLDVRTIFRQARFVQLQVIGWLVLVDHHQDGRVATITLDDPQPVVNVAFVLSLAGVENEQVEAALGQEELVGGVHDLLPAEVPDI